MFDPASVLMSAKSGMASPAWLVLMPNHKYLANERFQLRFGRLGVVIYAIIWLILLPVTGVISNLIQNPFIIAALYLFGFASALGGLAATFWLMPHDLECKSNQALILTPDGFILADWQSGDVLKAIDYHALDKLKLNIETDSEYPTIYRLSITQLGKTSHWAVPHYFNKNAGDIAGRIVNDYTQATGKGP